MVAPVHRPVRSASLEACAAQDAIIDGETVHQQHAAIPQRRKFALARGEMAGNLIRLRVREIPSPWRNGNLRAIERNDLWFLA